MARINRRELWTGAARVDSTAVQRFAPALSGREIIRRRSFPNVLLTTHMGKRARFYDDLLKDKAVVLNMMYADCNGVCPAITANLAKARTLLERRGAHDIAFYSITIKPEEDTPEKLRAYAEMHGVRGKWLFLTGDPADVETLRRTLGYVDINPEVDKDKGRHSGIVRYGNEPMSIWGACQGSANPEWIAEQIAFMLPPRRG